MSQKNERVVKYWGQERDNYENGKYARYDKNLYKHWLNNIPDK